MDKKVLLIAISRGRLPRVIEIADHYGFVVFGMMRGQNLTDPNAGPAYLYETG